MKTTTVLTIAFGVGALAACNKSPQAAENVETNYENVATENMTVENVTNETTNAGTETNATGDTATNATTNY